MFINLFMGSPRKGIKELGPVRLLRLTLKFFDRCVLNSPTDITQNMGENYLKTG
jgi:hypothetical protein